MQIKAAVCAAALALSGASAAHAQYSSMDLNAMNNAFNARMNAQMQQRTNGIVQQNMNNPQIVAMWRQNPRGMTLQQFAYAYAATGGFSRQGMANYNATSANIAARDRAAIADYRGAQANFGNAIMDRNAHAQANNAEMGRVIAGQQTYYNPANGANVSMSYIPQGQSYTQGGYTYQMAPNGQYYATTGNGWWTPVNPAAQSPR